MRVFLGFGSMKPEAMECRTQGRKHQKKIPSETVKEKKGGENMWEKSNKASNFADRKSVV